MNALLFVSILLVALVLGAAIWKKRELPESVSALVYELPEGGWRWLWTIWMWVITICIAPSLVSAMEDSALRFVGFLTIVCLLFVGAWPLFQDGTRKWHYVLAIAAGILSQVCVLIICPWWLLSWLLMVAVAACVHFNPDGKIAKTVTHKGTFIAECICYVSLVGSLLV